MTGDQPWSGAAPCGFGRHTAMASGGGQLGVAGLCTFSPAIEAEAVRQLPRTARPVSPNTARVTRCHPIDNCLSIFATDFRKRYDFASDRGNLVFG
jgi:hypothetical protein